MNSKNSQKVNYPILNKNLAVYCTMKTGRYNQTMQVHESGCIFEGDERVYSPDKANLEQADKDFAENLNLYAR